jgi:parallel beta-helix repeat protein
MIDGGGNGIAVDVTSDWVNITGFNMTSYKDQWDVHGIRLYGADHVSVTWSAISNVLHTAVFVQFSNFSSFVDNTFYTANTHIQLWHSSNSTINNNEFMYGTGVSGLHTYHNTVSNNTHYVGSYGVFLEDSGHNTIADNTFLPHYSSNFFIANGIKLQWSRGDIISGNNIRSEGISIDLSYSSDVTITHNTVAALHGNGMGCEAAICLEQSNDVTITYNDVSDSLEGILLYFSDNNLIDNNIVHDIGEGIVVKTSSDSNIITNNTVLSGFYHGIVISHSSNNVVSNNNASYSRAGMYMIGGTATTFHDNIMYNNGMIIVGSDPTNWDSQTISTSNTVNGRPVYYWKNVTGGKIPSDAGQVFLANCTGVVVENITFTNGTAGVGLGFSTGNLVANNTFQSNRVHGVYLQASPLNKIFHNNFADNGWFFPGYQGWDDGATNQWDDDYPSGGNYWNDYNGSDDLSGPNQDQPGSDGIGDTPHYIKDFGVDRYPLMTALQFAHPRPPAMKGAAFSGLNDADLTISWSLSPDDGQGFDSAEEYEVYRGETYSHQRSGYSLIASMPKGTTEYVDQGAGKGSPSTYFYDVCAVDSNGVAECAQSQAVKYSSQVSQGLSLFSIPIIEPRETIESILQTMPCERIWWFDSPSQEWGSVDRSKPYSGNLAGLSQTSALWLETSSTSEIAILGLVPELTAIDLHVGWNLIGFPAFDATYTVGDLMFQTGATEVEGFDAGNPPYSLKELSASEIMQPGYGYWIWVDKDTTWSVSNS